MSAPADEPAWKYESAPDLGRTVAERLAHFPREPDMLLFGLRSLAALGVRGWLKLYHRFSVEGAEHLPRSGSFVLIGNHASHLDAACLTACVPLRRLHCTFPAAAADYFFCNLPRSLLSTVVVNALPFDREAKGAESLEVCRQLLARDGNALVLFPEGTRSLDGTLGRFRSGIGRLVVGTPVPVVPCHLEGAHRAWPKGKALPRPGRLTLRIGAPRVFAHLEDCRESVTEICDMLREDVAALGSRART